jgi:hypothetical protein
VVRSLQPAAQPFLDHHRIDGTAVLPGVMGIEAFAEAGRLLFPELHVTAMEDVAFLAPFKFYRDEPREIEVRCRFEEDGDDVVVACGLWGRRVLAGRSEAQETLHFRGCVRLAREPVATRKAEPPLKPGSRRLEAADLYRVYFHGPAYRVLEQAWSAGDRVAGSLAAGLPPGHEPAEAPLATRPRLLELCFQTAGAWEIASSGRMGLPQQLDRVSFAPGSEARAAVAVVTPVGGDACDARVVDADGNVLVTLEGYHTVAVPQLLPEDLVEPIRRALG